MQDGTGLTELLTRAAGGDRDAFDRIFPLAYAELERLARAHLRREARGHTLETGALVHEAWLRMVAQHEDAWRDRAHFLALASIAMRRILVDHARRHRAARRGGGARRVTLDGARELAVDQRADLLVDLDEALARLATLDPRQARVVECRYFGGLTEEETAEALGVGLRTVKRDWAKARSWLFQALHPDEVA